jgi:iron complex transport system substrate-binding protein
MTLALLDRPTPIRDEATRRQFLIGGASLAALLAGCSTAAPASGAPATSAGFPVTIRHKYGSTEITKAPERVVAVGLTEQDTLLALGVTPVATREWFGEQPGALWPWARAAAGNAPLPEVLGYELNYEKIAALRPDLILGVVWGITDEEYPTLSQIAPTVAQSADFVDGGTPWQHQTRIIGRALGQQQRAAELVAAVEARFVETRRANPQFAGASAVAAYDFGDGELGIYGPQDPRARILTSLGFEVPPRIVELVGDEFFATISTEQLELVEADALLWIAYTEAGASRVQEQPLYRTLDVAREGRDLFLVGADPLGAAYAFSTVLSLPVVLDGLTLQLAAALNGNPTTMVVPR